VIVRRVKKVSDTVAFQTNDQSYLIGSMEKSFLVIKRENIPELNKSNKKQTCVCVCVWETERERERERDATEAIRLHENNAFTKFSYKFAGEKNKHDYHTFYNHERASNLSSTTSLIPNLLHYLNETHFVCMSIFLSKMIMYMRNLFVSSKPSVWERGL
jgi:hypothetical protein